MNIDIQVGFIDDEYWWEVQLNYVMIYAGSEKDKDLAWQKAIKKGRKELKKYL